MMGAAEELRVLANSIIDSYEMRVSMVNTLMGQANNLLKVFQIELEEMIALLRDNLAKSESLRKKDFEHMIKDVIERRIQRGQEAEQSFKLFQGEEEEMIVRLRDIIFSGNSSSLDDIEAIREDILRRQKMREKKIVKSLKCFQVEQEELRVALKKLLSKGENVKIKDFKTMINALRVQQSDHNTDMIRMLEEFDVVRDKVQTQWQAVSRVSV
jgi:translation initiation factor 1 (eIF-1/SUI1)